MKLDGRIVEYLENGKFICAFVFEDNGNRLRLLNQNSRELNLPQNRVVHLSKEKLPAELSNTQVIKIQGLRELVRTQCPDREQELTELVRKQKEDLASIEQTVDGWVNP